MKLPLKVALVMVALVVPLVALFTLWRVGAERNDEMERVSDRMATRISARPPLRCLEKPETWEFSRRGLKGWAYDLNLQSKNSNAPRFPAALKDVVQSEEPVHDLGFRKSGASAVRTGMGGACEVMLLRLSRPPPRGPVLKPIIGQSVALAFLLFLTGLVIAGPLVRRIRKLQKEVESAEAADFRVQSCLRDKDEIGDLARAFSGLGARVRQTIDDLKARDEALTEFVSNTTHDLAIPLTVLQHRLVRAIDEDSREHVEAALQESHYISSLVRNMGAAARLERTENVVKHQVNLVELLERVVQRHGPVAQWKNVEFNAGFPEEAVEIEADSTLLEQALSNLVQNAIQYVEPRGHVSVLLEQESRGAGKVWCVQVMDDGPGVPEAMLEELGERGARSDDARNRNPGGQGFGLNIARRVCRVHGWKLEFENTHPGLIARIWLKTD